MSNSAAALVNVRTAGADDAEAIFSLIQALADYEKLAHEVVGDAAAIAKHSSGNTDYVQATQRPYITTLLAEVDQTPVGLALFFQIYSTQAAAQGYYLEDLFVLPDYRQQGVGKALLRALAQYAQQQDAHELRWSVLDWNELAIAFYRRIGAEISETRRICRVSGEALEALGAAGDSESVSCQVVPPSEMADRLGEWQEQFADDANHGDRWVQGAMDTLVADGLALAQPFEIAQVNCAGQVMGIALFTHNYSTFLTQPGILIEAIALNSQVVGDRAERAVCQALAQLTGERQGGRLEWYVDAREPEAIERYAQWGASVLPDWRICRLDEGAIAKLAQS